MNSLVDSLYRALTCAAASAAITLVIAGSFVQSTSLPPGAHARNGAFVAVQPRHAWFGQPEPAVLVD